MRLDWNCVELIAIALARSSFGTRSDTIDCRTGVLNALIDPLRKANSRTCSIVTTPPSVSIASAKAQIIIPVWVQTIRRRRSMRSAMTPP